MNKRGLILFNKKPGITSFQALGEIKRALGTRKVGHTGTLDKFASGLLLILTEKALKLAFLFSACDKQYIGRIQFGEETDTLDAEGEIIAKANPPSRDDIEKILPQFLGEIMQAPPAYSAIHINGKRASQLSRAGKTFETEKRPITIYKLELLSWDPPFAEIFVHCSSGTYIRSLARDMAIAADSKGHLAALTRTQVAGFSLDMADNRDLHITNDQKVIKNEECEHPPLNSFSLLPIDKTVMGKLGIPWYEISSNDLDYIRHGKPLLPVLNGNLLNDSPLTNQTKMQSEKKRGVEKGIIAVFADEELAAIVEKSDSGYKYRCVMC